jgi:hypothetical protein
MPEPVITLDERDGRHVYYVDGIEKISVTQILDAAGLIDKTWYTEGGAKRGQYIAVATALDDRGGLVDANLRDDMRGYITAWWRFRAENEVEILDTERRCYEPTYQFTGTFDCTMILNGVYTLADRKTGPRLAWHQLQTAGYAMMPLPSVEPGSYIARCGIHLRKNGTYRLESHTDYGDRSAFLNYLAGVNWKLNHGYKTGVTA